MGNLVKIFAIAGPIALALMGAFITVWPPGDRARRRWFVAFAIVGLGAVTGGFVDSSNQDARVAELITGGDGYCYLRADPDDLARHNNPIRLWIEATGALHKVSIWISPGSAAGDHNDPRYWALRGQGASIYFDTVYSGGVLVGRAVSAQPQWYRIEFSAANGTFVEDLKIVEVNGRLVEVIELTKDAKTIYSKRPEGL